MTSKEAKISIINVHVFGVLKSLSPARGLGPFIFRYEGHFVPQDFAPLGIKRRLAVEPDWIALGKGLEPVCVELFFDSRRVGSVWEWRSCLGEWGPGSWEWDGVMDVRGLG